MIVAVYPLGILFAAANDVRGVELLPHVLGLIQAGYGKDAAGAVFEDGQEGRRRQEDVSDDGGRAR